MSPDDPVGKPTGSARPDGPGPMDLVGLGMVLTICTLGGLGAGWLIDRVAGTLPVFLMIGLIVGIILGGLACRAQARRW